MARTPSIMSQGSDAFTDFDRMLDSLQRILVTPDAATETKIRISKLERQKVATNIEHAREVLTQLEQEASTIRIQSQKQEVQADLIQKREQLQGFSERLKELNELGEHGIEDDDSSEGEDLIGEDTPDDETETETETDHDHEHIPPPTASAPTTDIAPSPTTSDPPLYSSTELQPESSGLRNRHDPRAELFQSSSAAMGRDTATNESLMTHNRAEQEGLTTSLLSMAAQLKQQSRAFAASLEDEKSVLDSAVEGLDRNELGMEAATRRMGFLTRASEGRGLWGRMLMYAYIGGLWVVLLVIVFVLPKLRF